VSCKDDATLQADFDKLILTLEQEFTDIDASIPGEWLTPCTWYAHNRKIEYSGMKFWWSIYVYSRISCVLIRCSNYHYVLF